MRSYEAARNLFSFLGFCSWVVIIVGAVVAFGGASAGSSVGRNAGLIQAIIAAAPGIIMAMIGFYGLALVQMGRAGVDSAEYSQQSLDIARQQLEISKQALQQGKQIAASYAGTKPVSQGANDAATDAPVGYADQSDAPNTVVKEREPGADAHAKVKADGQAAPALEKPHQEERLPVDVAESKPQPVTIPHGKFSGV